MTLVGTLATLLRLGVSVRLDGDRVRLKGPRVAVGELRGAVKQHRAEIVALLRPPAENNAIVGTPSDAGDDIRRQLVDDLAYHPDIDGLLKRFDRRRLLSLPAQYGHPSCRFSDENAAAMASLELRTIYLRGRWS